MKNTKRVFGISPRAVSGTLTLALLAILVIMGSLLSSCKKEAPADTPKSVRSGSITGDEAKKITQRIETFYTRICATHNTNLQHAKVTDAPTYTVDSAVYLMEGTFNMYSVYSIDSVESDFTTFQVTEPVSNGLIDETDVVDAFFRIKDSIMILYDSITFEDKSLTFLDIAPISSGGSTVSFKITAGISRIHTNAFYCNITFASANPNTTALPNNTSRVWKIVGDRGNSYTTTGSSRTYYYGYGQGFINSAGTTVTGNPVHPYYYDYKPYSDAATMLRQYGIGNYYGCASRPCGYYANVTTTYAILGTVLSSPTSSYFGAPIAGYDNKSIWDAYTFFDIFGNFYDPNLIQKQWLTIPMMDFYLSRIPGIITSNIPYGKTLYDFNIAVVAPTCNPSYGSPYPGQYWKHEWYEYDVTYGDFVQDCNIAHISISRIGLEHP